MRKLNEMDGQTDGRTDGGGGRCNISRPGPSAPREIKMFLGVLKHGIVTWLKQTWEIGRISDVCLSHVIVGQTDLFSNGACYDYIALYCPTASTVLYVIQIIKGLRFQMIGINILPLRNTFVLHQITY